MSALHPRKKPERTHDVRPERQEEPVVQDAVEGETVPLHIQPDILAAEEIGPQMDTELPAAGPEFPGWIFQPPDPLVREDLKRCAAPPGIIDVQCGNQRQGGPVLCLTFQIPALKIGTVLSDTVVVFFHRFTPVKVFRTGAFYKQKIGGLAVCL